MCLVRARQIAVRDISAAGCLQAVVLGPCLCQWNPAIVLQEPVDFIIGHVFLECWRSLTVKIGYSSIFCFGEFCFQTPNASYVSGYLWSSTGVPSEIKAIAVCVQPLVERRENVSGVRWQSFRWRFVFFIEYYNI